MKSQPIDILLKGRFASKPDSLKDALLQRPSFTGFKNSISGKLIARLHSLKVYILDLTRIGC